MAANERPTGLSLTAAFMSITNAMGWTIIEWSRPQARLTFALFTVFIIIGYFVIWFYWKGHNWARILVLLGSLLSIYKLHFWSRAGIVERVMIGAEAILGIFLLYWLNTSRVKAFFEMVPPRDE